MSKKRIDEIKVKLYDINEKQGQIDSKANNDRRKLWGDAATLKDELKKLSKDNN